MQLVMLERLVFLAVLMQSDPVLQSSPKHCPGLQTDSIPHGSPSPYLQPYLALLQRLYPTQQRKGFGLFQLDRLRSPKFQKLLLYLHPDQEQQLQLYPIGLALMLLVQQLELVLLTLVEALQQTLLPKSLQRLQFSL